jgi:hypothetical protein
MMSDRTDWQAIIERAAYTRFCRAGILEPFRLKWPDLVALASQLGQLPAEGLLRLRQQCGPEVVKMRVEVFVPSVGKGVSVMVDEWIP